MIKNILFDLDDTLLDFKMAEKVALTKTLEWAGINPDQRAIQQNQQPPVGTAGSGRDHPGPGKAEPV